MTAYPSSTYVYVSIDAASDISGDQLRVGPSLDTLPVSAEPVADPGADLLAVGPRPRTGRTRYWWRVLAGEGQQLPLSLGANTLYGQLSSSPEMQPHAWRFSLNL